ncbi:hypothetical protein EH223_15080 [candidate division KSB1 bacterium]|nr:MAG: hypothetical protein EH223_15080 [candidate division KSB1 bacterium]
MRRLFLLLVFGGTIPAFFIDPFYGVVHYSLINIIRPEQLLWGGGVGRIFYVDQFVLLLSWFINKDKLFPENTRLLLQQKLLWMLAFEMVIVTFTVAFNPDRSWHWTLGFIKMTFFCFVMSKAINTDKKLELYYAASIVWWTLLELWGIQQKYGGNARMEGLGGVLMPDINGFTSIVVLYLPMAYYTIFSRNKWIKFFIGIPSFIIFVIFILYSGSRGAFLGTAVCLMFILVRAKGFQKIKMILAFVIFGTLLGLILNKYAPEGFFDEYTARLSTMQGKESEETGEVEYEGSAAGRTAMWKGALYIYTHHPEYWLLGVGINCYAGMYFEYHGDELAEVLNEDEFRLVLFKGYGKKDLHNTFFDILLGGGAVTFLTWLFLVFSAWFQAHNIPKKYPKIVDGVDIHNYARAIEIGIIGCCVCMTFVTISYVDFFYWPLIMSGIIANLGKAKLKREALGQEDEEFTEQPVRKPAYAPYS